MGFLCQKCPRCTWLRFVLCQPMTPKHRECTERRNASEICSLCFATPVSEQGKQQIRGVLSSLPGETLSIIGGSENSQLPAAGVAATGCAQRASLSFPIPPAASARPIPAPGQAQHRSHSFPGHLLLNRCWFVRWHLDKSWTLVGRPPFPPGMGQAAHTRTPGMHQRWKIHPVLGSTLMKFTVDNVQMKSDVLRNSPHCPGAASALGAAGGRCSPHSTNTSGWG